MQDVTRHVLATVSLFVCALCPTILPRVAEAGAPSVTITILYNNVPGRADCITDWGFGCLVEGTDKTLLFDTGGDADILLHNMRRMDVDPGRIDAVVLSHIHGDHVGGLAGFLKHNHDVTVYLPASFPARFKGAVRKSGATVVEVSGSRRLCKGVYTTGEMGDRIREQALIVKTPKGMAIITGCAHPGIVKIVQAAREQHDGDIYLVTGGFHLSSTPRGGIEEIISRLREVGVRTVAPSHCTGALARDLFRDAWGRAFLDGGAGATIELPD